MVKPVGGRGKKATYETKVMRVPEVLQPVVEEMIKSLYESGEVLDKQTCNKFNNSQQEVIRKEVQDWIIKWLDKAGGKESQPRYVNLVKAIKEVQTIINQED